MYRQNHEHGLQDSQHYAKYIWAFIAITDSFFLTVKINDGFLSACAHSSCTVDLLCRNYLLLLGRLVCLHTDNFSMFQNKSFKLAF